MLTMKRFTVEPEVIAAGLSRAQLTPNEAASVRSLPRPPEPARTLVQAGLETPDGIVPEFAAALVALATPSTIVSVTTNRAGRSSFRTANFVRGPADGPVVMQAKTSDGKWDLVITPTVTEATVLMDQLLNITAFPGGAAGNWSLSLCGYAALLAMSDVLLKAQTQARLQRRLAKGPPALTPDRLEAQLQRGIAGNDTRWAVTAGQVTMLRGLRPAQGHMAEGLGELVSAGLASRRGYEVYPSDTGDALAATFAQLFSCGSVALSHASNNARGLVAFFSLFRSIAGLLAVNIASDDAAMPDVEIVRSTQAGVVLMMRRMLENRAPGPELLARSHPTRTAPPQQGHTQPPHPPPPPPPPTLTGSTWEPTHVTPSGGLQAWGEPNPAVPPTTSLPPQLPVRVMREANGWAQVKSAAGRAWWVDARRLEEIR